MKKSAITVAIASLLLTSCSSAPSQSDDPTILRPCRHKLRSPQAKRGTEEPALTNHNRNLMVHQMLVTPVPRGREVSLKMQKTK